MEHASRTVERLRLRAPSEALLRRTVIRLEDALRTASLPDRGATVVVVRRLALGRIEATASTQTLAVALEAGVSALGAGLIHASDPGAERADAVSFRDALEVHCLAALRAASEAPLDAWYWPLVLPVLKRSGAAEPVLRAIAFSLARLEEAPTALPHWTRTLAVAGHADRLVAALYPGDGAALLDAAGVAAARAASAGSAMAAPRHDLPPRHRPSSVTNGAREVAGGNTAAEDDRHVFVRAMLMRAGAAPDRARDPNDSRLHRERAVASPAGAVHDDGGRPRAPEQTQWSGPTGADAAGLPARSTPSTAVDGAPAEPIEWQSAASQPTRAGGLLFLVSVLRRCGFDRWSSARREVPSGPSGAIVGAIVARLLTRLRVDADDPMWALAGVTAHGRLSSHAPLADAWLCACRHRLRRGVRVGLGTLVLRPARLALTPTHADVFFRLDAIDLRVRRAGLDIDPGWVPWLGRAVTFHYGDEPRT